MDTPRLCRAVRGAGGWSSSRFGLIRARGEDAAAYLDSQLPAPVHEIQPGQGRLTARLERRGRIQCLVVVVNVGDGEYLLLTHGEWVEELREDLERFHIRERVVLEVPSDAVVFDLAGPKLPEAMRALLGSPVNWEDYAFTSGKVVGAPVRVVSHPWPGTTGGHLIAPADQAGFVADALRESWSAGAELTPQAAEALLFEGGWPLREDLGERALISELGREEEMVSFTKGCYLGQETVARVHHRGKVPRRLMGITGDGDEPFPTGALVQYKGDTVGEARRSMIAPSLEAPAAFAWIKSWAADPGTVVHVAQDGRLRAATVRELPFYRKPTAREEADRLHRRGMKAFSRDDFQAAVADFEKAVLLNPGDLDAYEAMGVCHERLGQLDEAVRVMEELKDMAPDHVMAWTNLSRYYAAQGMIQEAEEAKGQAAYLSMKQSMGEAEAQKKAEEEAKREEAQTEERVELFRQVLALDAEDVVANFGLGKLYLDRGAFDQAAPLLRKAIEVKANYSMAYNHLATCLAALDRHDEALDVLRRGIEVAGKQGDLMPKQSMERRLKELEAGSATES